MSSPDRVPAALAGVPETTLWTLYARARDSQRPGSQLRDPMAVELVARIDFDFAGRFGRRATGLAGWIGQRALAFDAEVTSVLATDPDAMVVVLGEGLETQFWRVDNGRVRWFSVELPETAAVRRAALGEDPPRRRLYAGSALDSEWLQVLGATSTDRVVVVAQGLLMYLPPAQVRALIVRCARRFPGGVMVFDTVPRWASALTTRGWLRAPSGYTPPPMPWGCNVGEHLRLSTLDPAITRARVLTLPPMPGMLTARAMPLGRRIPGIRAGLPAVIRLDFRD
ncbi:MAG: class I SAM-dependent methyltransferase [Sporichthyaceae bacterium]